MGFKWSKNQLDAIQTLGSNVLVSAGAGSGKTAVLTERIFQIVKSGHSLSKFLVLTFTNAAASEMKIRLRDKILGDSSTSHLTSELEAAHIETFDAFSLYLVKKYSSFLHIPSDINVMDSSLLNIQKKKIIDQVFHEYYLSHNPLFIQMINTFCLKSDQVLRDYVEQILKIANLKIDKDSFFHFISEECYDEKLICSYVEDYFQRGLSTFRELRTLSESLSDIDDSNGICEVLNQLTNAQDYNQFSDSLDALSFPKQKSNCPEEDKPLRSYIAETFSTWKKHHFGHRESILKSFALYKPFAQILIDMVKTIEERFLNFKKETHSYDFPDIARMALEVISISEAKDEIRNAFDYIMVDEYQDTSDVQERVIQALARDNLYMVGDVKQSIYRFRNANCQIFQDKFSAYKKNQGGREIDLNISFRSRHQIIEFINESFAKLMDPRYNIINYEDGHQFVYEPVIYGESDKENSNYQPKIYRYPSEKNDDNVNKEIAIIADDILNKINDHCLIYDKEINSNRFVKYSDFAIIVDRGSDFEKYQRYFSTLGIPLNIIRDERIDNSMLGFVTKNLITLFSCVAKRTIDDTFSHAYVAISRSFLLRLPDQEIFEIVKNKLYPHTDLYQKVERVVELTKDRSLYEILHALYEEFDIYHKLLTLDKINNNVEMVDTFLTFTKSMDDLGFSIDEFSSYFDELTNYGLEVKVARKEKQNNAVTLITIHRSKGLEYPIVYLPGLFKSFYRKEVNTQFLASPLYGIFFPLPTDFEFDSFPYYLIKEKFLSDDFEEKLRLFYVAITRVREQLIFLYPQNGKASFIGDLKHAKSFKDFLEYLGLPNQIGENYSFKNASITLKSRQKPNKIVTIKEIALPFKLVEKTTASKKTSVIADPALLEFGSQLHHLLEIVDYENKDLSFIKNEQLARCVSNVLNTSIFKNVKNENLRHEYEFYDEINEVHGIIDCLIIKNDEIIIVDFKLKNLDDEQYIKQLYVYRDYIKSISDKPIRLYLVSAMTGEEREIG
ncbi:MAG TPA: UvrD-helicase domain-containing protein [Bacilli bacterium]|mgnify:CR=1 FL=1|nr:UvrD-helicase domain-containing protein [Bacilli bacterium]